MFWPPKRTRWQIKSSNRCSQLMWEEKEEEMGVVQYGKGQELGDSGSLNKEEREAIRGGRRASRGWWESR